MGLERLMRSEFGTTPQIDLDRSMVRTRIAKSVTFNFAELADKVRRTNVRTLEVHLEAAAEVRDGKVILNPSGQAFPLEGTPRVEPGIVVRRMKVHGWDTESPRLEPVR
jgi:hypothetical protein